MHLRMQGGRRLVSAAQSWQGHGRGPDRGLETPALHSPHIYTVVEQLDTGAKAAVVREAGPISSKCSSSFGGGFSWPHHPQTGTFDEDTTEGLLTAGWPTLRGSSKPAILK